MAKFITGPVRNGGKAMQGKPKKPTEQRQELHSKKEPQPVYKKSSQG